MRIPLLLLCGLALSGCSEWPRFGNVEPGPSFVPAGTDPRSTVEVSWGAPLADSTDDELPSASGAPAASLALNEGVEVAGTLQGTGWFDELPRSQFTDAACPDTIGTRSPLQTGDGDYYRDVDFTVIEATEAGTLCGMVALAEAHATVGYDLVPFNLDACSQPIEGLSYTSVDSDLVAFGANLGGTESVWSTQVAAGDAFGILFASYVPNSDDAVPYRIGFALVPNAEDGGPGTCPLMPGGAQ